MTLVAQRFKENKVKLLVLIAMFPVVLVAQIITPSQMGYTYTLATDMTNVTLGVKDASGGLIRTLVPKGQAQNAGTYSGVWDGLTDGGVAATGGPFSIVMLYGNPTYTFNGLIGNTSNSLSGYSRIGTGVSHLSEARMTFIGDTGWMIPGPFSEGLSGLMYFSDTNPNSPNQVSPSYGPGAQNIGFNDIDNDGQYLYMTSVSCFAGSVTFVTKFDGFSGRPVLFTQGQTTVGPTPATGGAITYAYPGTTMSGIDTNGTFFSNPPTAIAVQTGGNILAVGHGNWYTSCNGTALNTGNTIKFFDKTTGLAVGTNATLANPVSMAFNSAGNLWVIGNNVLNLITSPSGSNTITQPISGLSTPIAVAVNKTNDHIYVLDGGTSQQLKEFDTSYALVRTYGVLGGYTDCNPTVAPNRLMVDNTAVTGVSGIGAPFTGVALAATGVARTVRVENSGDVWITDAMNAPLSARVQHLTPNGASFNLVNQMQYTALEYKMAVSHTMPTRIFANFNEYQFNFNVANNPGDPQAPGGTGSWQLVRNWAVGFSGACGSTAGFLNLGDWHESINSVEQLSNGRIYAQILAHGSALGYLAEMPTNGTSPLRMIGVMAPTGGRPWIMARDGSQYSLATSGSGASSVVTISKTSIASFDGSNNPVYGAPVQMASVTFDAATQPTPAQGTTFGYQNTFEPTTGGTYAVWQVTPKNSSVTTNFPHIAGMKGGRTSYLFTAGPELCSLFPGVGSLNGSYPCSNQTFNAGPGILTEGRQIIFPYTTNSTQWEPMYWHYWEDGMFIGQFGPHFSNSYVPTGPNTISFAPAPGFFNPYNPAVGFQGAQPYQALGWVENVGSTRLLAVNGDIYLFLDAEGGASTPISIWRISNLSSIHEVAGTGTLGQSVTLNTPVF